MLEYDPYRSGEERAGVLLPNKENEVIALAALLTRRMDSSVSWAVLNFLC